jgi:hypothetical protein
MQHANLTLRTNVFFYCLSDSIILIQHTIKGKIFVTDFFSNTKFVISILFAKSVSKISHTTKTLVRYYYKSKRKANWIGHILCRNCLLQRVIEGKIKGGVEVTGRRGRRCSKLLDELKERRGYSHPREESLDRTMWTARFGRGLGPAVRQTAE